MRRVVFWGLLLLFSFLWAGCNTIKGATKGAAEGVKEDWKVLEKADQWFREHYW